MLDDHQIFKIQLQTTKFSNEGEQHLLPVATGIAIESTSSGKRKSLLRQTHLKLKLILFHSRDFPLMVKMGKVRWEISLFKKRKERIPRNRAV